MADTAPNGAVTPERRALYLWRTERISRFMERQARERRWIPFKELAERYGRERDTAEGLDRLAEWVGSGKLEIAGRSRCLYLHPQSARVKLTRQMLVEVQQFGDDAVRSAYIGNCWMPRDLAVLWCRENQVDAVWLLGRKAAKADSDRRGPKPFDDTGALALMVKKVADGNSVRQAARDARVELQLTAPTYGQSDMAIEERLRAKYRNAHDP